MTASLRGRLLVAAPTLRDPNFDRTVVLVLEHTDDGALGVVLNRPSDIEVADALPGGWDLLAAEPPVVFLGGPVAPTGAICVARRAGRGARPYDHDRDDDDPDDDAEDDDVQWQPLFGDLGIVDLERPPEDVAAEVADLRVFVGHAGWGPGQLEGEVEVGGWFVLDAFPDDSVAARPEALWELVLRRQGGALARVALFPPDPTMN